MLNSSFLLWKRAPRLVGQGAQSSQCGVPCLPEALPATGQSGHHVEGLQVSEGLMSPHPCGTPASWSCLLISVSRAFWRGGGQARLGLGVQSHCFSLPSDWVSSWTRWWHGCCSEPPAPEGHGVSLAAHSPQPHPCIPGSCLSCSRPLAALPQHQAVEPCTLWQVGRARFLFVAACCAPGWVLALS